MPSSEVALAVDWGGTKTMVGLIATDGRVIAGHTTPTPAGQGIMAVRDHILALSRGLLEEEGVAAGQLRGVGVTVPGMADPMRGTMLYAPAHGWRDVPVRSWFQALWPDLAVYVDNDVNACAWGEYCFGAAQGADSLLWLTVSTGIGGGLVLSGRVYGGANGLAGEIGHLVLEEGGPLCGCGQRGCLEALAAGPAIARRAAELMHSGRATALSTIRRPLTARDVAEAARQGDALARQVMAKTAWYLGRGIAMAANVLNPGMVVMGGGVSRSLDLMLQDIERTAQERAILVKSGGALRVTATSLGYEAALIGAGALVHHPAYSG